MKTIKKIDTAGKLITIICLTLTIFTITVIVAPEEAKDTVATESKLSNEKIGWGIKRNDNNAQPDLGATNKKLIEKYNGIAMRKQ